MQNIPSGNKTIRLMFKASPGYSIVGGDFSQQEPLDNRGPLSAMVG